MSTIHDLYVSSWSAWAGMALHVDLIEASASKEQSQSRHGESEDTQTAWRGTSLQQCRDGPCAPRECFIREKHFLVFMSLCRAAPLLRGPDGLNHVQPKFRVRKGWVAGCEKLCLGRRTGVQSMV